MTKIHQALYGYREGHRLLASSLKLSAADRQRMGVQTDNSDAGKSGEWEALLAGYPLESGLFAWSLTWPAPEMPRPGCVWSHSLIVDPADLPALGPADFLAAFRLPTAGEESLYSRPLEVSPTKRPSQGLEVDSAFLTALLWSFYEPPLMSVRASAVPWEDRDRHQVLISMWMQQWAALRGASSFSDAPSTPRRLDERTPYDLQLHRSGRVAQRREEERVLGGVPKARPPIWATEAASDLLARDGLSEFLETYGEELGADRSAFRSLVSIWLADGGDQRSIEVALNELIALFPEREQGSELKHALLDLRQKPRGFDRELDSEGLLHALLAMPVLDALSLENLGLRRRLGALLKERPDRVSEILAPAGEESTELHTAVLDYLANPKSPHSRHWLVEDLGALRKLIALRPDVSASPQLWRRADSELLLPAIASLRGKEKRQRALKAMLASETELDPAVVLKAWEDSEALVLDLLAASPPKKAVAEPWLDALPPAAITRWLNANHATASPSTARLLINSLVPRELAALSPEIMLEQLANSDSQELAARAFLTATAVAEREIWAPVAVLAFERLTGPKAGRPSRAASSLLMELEPSGAQSAAMKQRTARALNLAFQEDYWDPLASLKLSAAPFNALIAADKKAGLARRILSASVEQPDAFKGWQRDALMRNVEARADRASLLGLLKRLVWPF